MYTVEWPSGGSTSRKGESVSWVALRSSRITRMKALMHGLVWWPGIDTDVEKSIKECSPCQQTQPSPPFASLHPWEWPRPNWRKDAASHYRHIFKVGGSNSDGLYLSSLDDRPVMQTVCTVWFAYNLSVGQSPAIHCSRVWRFLLL